MKSMYGKMIRLLIAPALVICLAATAHAQENSIEFTLTAANCGSEAIQATAGSATLSASGDGVNAEKIKWDSDPERLYPRMQGKNLSSGWHMGGYWLIEFSGINKQSMKLSADMYSTKKAPRDFELMYSTDGISYTAIPDSAVALDNSPAFMYKDFPLPETLNNAEKIYLKIIICSDISVGGSSITGIKDGSTYINNIKISYNGSEDTPPAPTPEPEPEPEGSRIFYPARENIYFKRLHAETGRYRFILNNAH